MNKQILNLYQQGCGVIDTAELLGVRTDKVMKVMEVGHGSISKSVVRQVRQGAHGVQAPTKRQSRATAQS